MPPVRKFFKERLKRHLSSPIYSESSSEDEGGSIRIRVSIPKTKIQSHLRKTLDKAHDKVIRTLSKRKGLPPAVRKWLEEHGDETVSSLTIVRAPVQAFLNTALEAVSGGRWKQALAKAGYDGVFHLALEINGRYLLDKQEVIKVGEPRRQPHGTTYSVAVPQDLTIRQMVDKTGTAMGTSFTTYSARNNNCQDFVLAFLRANDLATPEATGFVKQDAQKIFEHLPSFTSRAADALTDAAAVGDKILHGGSVPPVEPRIDENKFPPPPSPPRPRRPPPPPPPSPRTQPPSPTSEEEKNEGGGVRKKPADNKKMEGSGVSWKAYWAQQCKGKKFGSREAVNQAMKEAAKAWRAKHKK